jgi:GNAT superfamily N-acetyltransferase
MNVSVTKVKLADLGDLRADFLKEINNQFVCDKCHLYGWADVYLFRSDATVAGYGSVWGTDKREERDAIFEFYLIPEFRKEQGVFFQEFVRVSGATIIEAQTNDPCLSPLMFEFGSDLNTVAILFEDGFDSNLEMPGVKLVLKTPPTRSVEYEYLLLKDDEEVASGGLLLNYNFPYADIYYDVREEHRRKGLGSFIVQELKTEAYRMGRVPSARCNVTNYMSKRTMMKAGMSVCGWRVVGKIDVKRSG